MEKDPRVGSLMRLNKKVVYNPQATLKSLIEAYNCRLCKIKLTEENFGGLGPNHMIGCQSCKEKYPEEFY